VSPEGLRGLAAAFQGGEVDDQVTVFGEFGAGLVDPGAQVGLLFLAREQDALLEQMNDAYARQREDPAAWEAERDERDAWERTLLDGLTQL